MKKFIIILIVVVIICLAISGTMIILYGENFIDQNSDFEFNFFNKISSLNANYNTYVIDESVYSTIDEFSKISASAVIGNIIILESDNNEVKAELVGSITTRGEKPYLSMKAKEEKILFEVNYPPFNKSVSISSSDLTLTIYVPKTFKHSLYLKTISGDIIFDDFHDLDYIDLTNVSGNILVNNISSNSIDIGNTSGNIKIENISFNNSTISSVSGKINVSGNPGISHLSSVSGQMDLAFIGTINNSDIETVSGSIKLHIDDNQSFDAFLDSVSGKYHIDIPVSINSSSKNSISFTIGDSPLTTINISSVSGNISIDRN